MRLSTLSFVRVDPLTGCLLGKCLASAKTVYSFMPGSRPLGVFDALLMNNWITVLHGMIELPSTNQQINVNLRIWIPNVLEPRLL